MSVLVLGGGLQGFELCYLAGRSGRNSVLVDRKKNPIAGCVADDFFCLDVLEDFDSFVDLASEVDYLVPATENQKTLRFLYEKKDFLAPEILFDFESFFDLSNKRDMYRELRSFVETPASFEDSSPPWIVKPIYGSGSEGVRKISSVEELDEFSDGYVVQDFIDGVHYSTEAVVRDGEVYEYLTTVLEFDGDFGCCRVLYRDLDDNVLRSQANVIKNICDGLDLDYLFDVQTVRDDDTYLIEINPRFPSQTPIAVYWASGINLLEEMIDPEEGKPIGFRKNGLCVKPTIYEHFRYDGEDGDIINIGEIKLLGCTDYRRIDFDYCEDFFVGETGEKEFVGTVVFTSDTMEDVKEKRNNFYRDLKLELG